MIMEWIDDLAQMAKDYLAKNPSARVYPEATAIRQLDRFDIPLQREPIDARKVLALLYETGSPATVRSTGGRYYGFVTGGSLPAAMGAKLLSTVWDQNAALTVMSPLASFLETVAGKWLLSLFGLPAAAGL